MDTFEMLKRLLSQNEFELLLPDQTGAKEKNTDKTDIRLVYQMNDTIESFLVFKEAKMTGTYKEDYEGAIEASFYRDGDDYALVVRQEEEDCVVTILFKTLELETNLYNYGDIAHFWRKGYENLRQLEFRIAVLWDKYEYLGEAVCNEEERKLVQLAYFPPLNYTCYPAVSKQYIVPRDNPWIPSDGAFSLMKEMAEQVGDRKIKKWIHFYERYPYPVVARYLAVLLHRNAHANVVDQITERLKKATSVYPNRSFGEKEDENIGKLLGRAEKRKEELERAGIHAEVLHEEPFTTAKDTLDFHVYVMQLKKGVINRKVLIEEISEKSQKRKKNFAMNELMEQIKKKDARSFTHGGKFHADDVFSAALLFYINPEITILRGNRVPDDFDGIVFDIGRGAYDHHQRDSRVRENGVPYAAFGLLWEAVGAEILGEELAEEFDEAFVQPLDHNDNTGEKNELATLIGNFNPTWDAQGGNDEAFFQAVSVAGMILENKFERYRGNERADRRVEEILEEHRQAVTSGKRDSEDEKILILPEFVPCQKRLSETEIAFVIFPSNRGGYCIQPQKKEYSMNYKCSFPAEWLGLENEELEQVTGLQSAGFCHKGGFLMTVGMLEDAVKACRISMELYHENPTIVNLGGDSCIDPLLKQLPGMQEATVIHMDFMQLPQLTVDGIYGEAAMDKQQWKNEVKENLKRILKQKPEAVYVEGNVFETYPIVHQLRKKHIPVLTMMEKDGQKLIIRIPSGS